MSLTLNKPKLDNLAGDIWKSAERPRGKFKAYEYQSVILPIIVIRRLECVLLAWREAKRAAVLAKRPNLSAKELTKLVKELELNPKQSPFSNKTDWTPVAQAARTRSTAVAMSVLLPWISRSPAPTAPASPPTPVATLLLRATIAVTIREAGLARVGVMIPRCNDDGYLPPGIHPASLEEIAARFGQESELRQVQMQSLRWLFDVARRAGVQRVVVNGSFVTDKLEPNDVDCVLLIGPGFPRDRAAEAELLAGLPFINMELVGSDAFQQFTEKTYATDRNLVPKGMLEVTP